MQERLRVMLVDDHPLFRAGVSRALEGHEDLLVCCEASTLVDARDALTGEAVDVVVLDLSLPDGSGLDLLQWMGEHGHTARVIVLSVHHTGEFVRAAFRCGARGYLTKGAPAAELHAAIRVVADGGVYADNDLTSLLLDAEHDSTSDLLSLLTQREREVAEHLTRGFTTVEVASRLGVSPKTIEAHRASIFRKLNLRNVVQLTRIIAAGETDAV